MSYRLLTRVAISSAAIAGLAACASTTPTAAPTPSAVGSPSTSCPAVPSGPDAPQLSPNGWGDLRLGLTKTDAAATCLVDVDIRNRTCDGITPLTPKDPYASSFDVVLDRHDRVIGLGGSGRNLVTTAGVRIGSSLAQVKRAYPEAVGPVDLGGDAAPYHQSGVFIRSGQNYLGLLFDAPAAKVRSTDTVRFMEIRLGGRPPLFRDGC
jgi:hypothetical protein